MTNSTVGRLRINDEISYAVTASATVYPLYALSPILILNQAPTVSTGIPNQTAFADVAFTYAFPDTTFADADSGGTLTYSASESLDAAWLTFDPATRTFSGTPAVANDGDVITITVTASDDMDLVTDVFTVTVKVDTTAPEFTSGAGAANVDVTKRVGLGTNFLVYNADATDSGGVTYTLDGTHVRLFTIDDSGRVQYKDVPMTPDTQTLIVIATDAAGNSAQQVLTIVLTAAPIVTITTDVVGDYANGPFTATFTWDQEVSEFDENDLDILATTSSFETVTAGRVYTVLVTSIPANDLVVSINVRAGAASSMGLRSEASGINVRYDDMAPEFTDETAAITFALGSPSGTEVYNAEATDGGDADDGITYSLGGTDAAEFDIDSGTGSVTYTTAPSAALTHTITITATDKGGNPDTITVTITATATVTGVRATTDGFHKGGASVTITVDFSEAVSVTGTPQLALNTGNASNGTASYISGSSTTLTLTHLP